MSMTDGLSATELERSIAKTLSWFSIFTFPLTTFEIHKWMFEPKRPFDLSDVCRVLETSEWLKKHVWRKNGFLGLKRIDGKVVDIDEWILKRKKGYIDSTKKMRALKRVGMYFRLFGSVRMVSAVNSIAWAQTQPKSDIDLFVVTKPNSIWFTRFFMVLPFMIFGARPISTDSNEKKRKNVFCFSFFLSEESLCMKKMQLDEDDYYLPLWIKSMIPILDHNQTLKKIRLENSWTNVYFPNAKFRSVHMLHHPNVFPPLLFSNPIFNRVCRIVQERRFPVSIRSLANKDTRVIISDSVLKFHDGDRRAVFRDEFKKRYASLV